MSLSFKVPVLALALLAGAVAVRANQPLPIEGNPSAAVHVIIYQDLECPMCAQWHAILQSQIIPQYGSRVAFEFRDFPLRQHTWSFQAAVLARFFDSRQLSWGLQWRDYCFLHQTDFTAANLLDKAAAFGAPLGITRAELNQALTNQQFIGLVQANYNEGLNLDHVQHTPTVLLDGVEATTPDQLKAFIDLALRQAR